MINANMWKALLVFVLSFFALCSEASSSKKRACIIGAGAAGLISVRQLTDYPNEFDPIVFEKQSDVGGLWIYTDSTTVDKHGLPVHSSLYKYLRTNFPRELQTYADYPEFRGDESKGSFVEHPELLQYLRNYTEHYNLRQYIQFDTNVEKVRPLPNNRWRVVTQNLNNKKRTETVCDAVFVGNGQYVKGNIPKIPGIENFPGRVIHSHVYRRPEEFANKTVVLLGASFSGLDIGIEVAGFADKIYLSSRHAKLPSELPRNLEQVAGVVSAEGSEFILSDGSRIKADALILCTGYVYDFPFLDESTGIVVEEGKYVKYVYKHLINIPYPTMAIFNLPSPGLPFQIPHAQVAYFIAVLRGKVVLPSREEMLKEAELPAGVPKSKAHFMMEQIPVYYNELASAAGANTIPDWYASAAFQVLPQLLGDPMNFRKKKLHFESDGSIKFY